MAVNNISYPIYPLSTRTEKSLHHQNDTFLFLFRIYRGRIFCFIKKVNSDTCCEKFLMKYKTTYLNKSIELQDHVL